MFGRPFPEDRIKTGNKKSRLNSGKDEKDAETEGEIEVEIKVEQLPPPWQGTCLDGDSASEGQQELDGDLAIIEAGLGLRGEGPADGKVPSDVALVDVAEPGGTGRLGEVASHLLNSAGVPPTMRAYSAPGGLCGFSAFLSATGYQSGGKLLSSLLMDQQQAIVKDFVAKAYAEAQPEWVSTTLTPVFPDVNHTKFKARPQHQVSFPRPATLLTDNASF